jgi:hypothetical protein
VAAVAEIGGAEHQPLAHCDTSVPSRRCWKYHGAVDGIAVEHGADDLLVAQDDPLVDAAVGVLQHDLFLVRPGAKSPAENRSMPVTFSLVETTEPS